MRACWARSDPHGEFGGLNCLIERASMADAAAAAGVPESEAEGLLAEAREILHARRAKRPRPHLDDKVHFRADSMQNGNLIKPGLISPCLHPRC